jgi:hypothetical protein
VGEGGLPEFKFSVADKCKLSAPEFTSFTPRKDPENSIGVPEEKNYCGRQHNRTSASEYPYNDR